MLRGWYLAGLLLPFGNVSKSSVESYFTVIKVRVKFLIKITNIRFILNARERRYCVSAVSINMVVLKICRIVERAIRKGNDVR